MAAPLVRCRRILQSVQRLIPLYATLWRGCLHLTKPCMSTAGFSGFKASKPDAVSLREKFSWIEKQAPVFGVSGETISILSDPTSYYDTVKSLARRCKRRMVLASLYLGTGELEQGLVLAIQEALQDSPSLEVTVLLDCTRGSRGEHNSRTMLLPLLKQFPGRVKVFLYHTPDLRGVLKRLIPERYNEVVGLSHLKVYIFDDTFVTSGANLSDSYFTNRQDRYVKIKDCPHLVSFYESLVKAICSFSFQLHSNDTLTIDKEFGIHPYKGDEKKFKEKAKARVESVISPKEHDQTLKCVSQGNQSEETSRDVAATDAKTMESGNISLDHDNIATRSHGTKGFLETDRMTKHIGASKSSTEPENSNYVSLQEELPADSLQPVVDTWIYPLVQMGPLGIRVDQMVTAGLLENLEEGSRLHLASGYFNLTQQYKSIILRSREKCEILLASPQVNGFYGAAGISGYIPDSYTYIAKKFYEAVRRRKLEKQIRMHEYYRDRWTFHAKGLWYYLPGQKLPSLCLIGSPNFGHRSVSRDLESQLAILTTNKNLQQQLHQEQESLYSRAETVDDETYEKPDRKVALWVKIVTFIAHNFY